MSGAAAELLHKLKAKGGRRGGGKLAGAEALLMTLATEETAAKKKAGGKDGKGGGVTGGAGAHSLQGQLLAALRRWGPAQHTLTTAPPNTH